MFSKIKIFISSVQSEFEFQRLMLFEYINSDALLGMFFDVFIFEKIPANSSTVQEVYLKEVEKCDIYIGIFGEKYGYEDEKGISPTEKEFNLATELYKTKFIFISENKNRHPKEEKLIEKAEQFVVRKSFNSDIELKTSVYNSLIHYLEHKEYIVTLPFDATINRESSIDNIDENKIKSFVQLAKRKRGFPLDEDVKIEKILTHLNLIKDNKVTNAAILLFGKEPQKFFITSEIKCAQFYGTTIEKPIPSYQVYKGDVFELVNQAVDFVLSKIDYSIGTRKHSAEVETKYEIPVEAITEAIVNAVAHRDYTSNGSVQVMLFRDRLEISNPGKLPLELTTAKLKQPHHSIPANPLLAESIYLAGYIERMGTGTGDIVSKCLEYNLKEPEFIQEDIFKVIIWRKSNKDVGETVGEKLGEKLGEKQSNIVNEISKDSTITIKQLSIKLNVSTTTIEKHISILKEKEIIERVGSAKGGYWKIKVKN